MSAKAHINVSKIFNAFDMDMTKDIDIDEFRKVIRKDLKIGKKNVSEEHLKEIFVHIDRDSSGAVTLQEFASFSREAQKAEKSGEVSLMRRVTSEASRMEGYTNDFGLKWGRSML